MDILQRVQQQIQQIEAYPGKTITTAVLRDLGIKSTDGSRAADYFFRRFGIQPIGYGRIYNKGYSLTFDKGQLLAALREDAVRKGRLKDAPPAPDLPALFERSAPPAPAPAPAPDLPALFERFQRDFAATIDALHQDLASRLDQQQRAKEQGGRQLFAALKKLNDCAPPTLQPGMDAVFTHQQEISRELIKRLDALTTLTEAVLAFAKPNGAASERMEKQMEDIAEYFRIHQQANRIIFKKIEALSANVEKLNQELGVTA